jgi:O-antigen/teichoic acid export membrane protein
MSIGRNAGYNLLGFLVPALLGLIAVPAYLALIGTERFGVMALAWLVLGYFGLFDLGLGRATAQRIAVLREATDEERTVALGTSLVANLGIGLAGAAMLYPAGWYLFSYVFDLTPAMRIEALAALPLLVFALPVATTMGVLSGALQGRAKFLEFNRISIASTAIFQFLPLGVAWLIGPELPWVMGAAIIARLIGAAMLWRACRRIFRPAGWQHWDRSQLLPMLSFGGWVTITAAIGPLLVFSDRFIIGSVMGAVAVTIYTVPLDATRRLSGAAQALTNALFPRLAVAGEEDARKLSRDAVSAMYAALTPAVGAALFVMEPAMRLWLGNEIGGHAAPLARLFLVATWVNCFAQIPFTRLQALGRPDLVAKVHVIETPFYLAALWIGLDRFGLAGAAWVYLVRVIIDTAILFWLDRRSFERLPLIGVTLALFCIAIPPLDRAMIVGIVPAALGAIATAAVLLVPAAYVMPRRVWQFPIRQWRGRRDAARQH